MANDHDDVRQRNRALREKLQRRLDELRGRVVDTPGHRERMARVREGLRLLNAMVSTTNLRVALDTACAGCGDPDHDRNIDRAVRHAAHVVVRTWTLFGRDLRTLTRELREAQPGDPLADDERFAVDETLFHPLDLPDRMSRTLAHLGGGAPTWLALCRADLVEFLRQLIPPMHAPTFADALINGFTANLRAAVDADDGTLRIYGWIITKTDRGYDIANDVPPPPPSAS